MEKVINRAGMEKSIRIRISKEIKEMVETLAKEQNRSVSGYIKNMIIEEYKKLQEDKTIDEES